MYTQKTIHRKKTPIYDFFFWFARAAYIGTQIQKSLPLSSDEKKVTDLTSLPNFMQLGYEFNGYNIFQRVSIPMVLNDGIQNNSLGISTGIDLSPDRVFDC